MSMFSDLEKDRLTIVKQDGQVITNVRASVQGKTVFISDEKVPLEEGDKLYRELPSGLSETFVVEDRGFFNSSIGMSHYEAKVRKEGNIDKKVLDRIVNVYNVTGQNAKVNINSVDNSTNTVSSERLFVDLRNAIGSISDVQVRERSLKVVEELERAKGSASFADKYKELIQTLANHVTIIAPLLPALALLLH